LQRRDLSAHVGGREELDVVDLPDAVELFEGISHRVGVDAAFADLLPTPDLPIGVGPSLLCVHDEPGVDGLDGGDGEGLEARVEGRPHVELDADEPCELRGLIGSSDGLYQASVAGAKGLDGGLVVGLYERDGFILSEALFSDLDLVASDEQEGEEHCARRPVSVPAPLLRVVRAVRLPRSP